MDLGEELLSGGVGVTGAEGAVDGFTLTRKSEPVVGEDRAELFRVDLVMVGVLVGHRYILR